jgi:hypothetical protein
MKYRNSQYITRKNLFTSLTFLMFATGAFAQVPEKMSYQAVVRNTGNVLVVNQVIGMQINIVQGSASGIAVYRETQTPTSNNNGLVSIEIGTGTVVTGVFSNVDWTDGPYFIKTESDPTGGTNYTITGTSQLLSVPYAMHAKTADVSINDADTDPTNEVNSSVVLNGLNLEITDAGGTLSTDLSALSTQQCNLAFGDTHAGGIIFYIDGSGCHGLVAKANDEAVTYKWSTRTFNTYASAVGIYSGAQNTNKSMAKAVISNSDCPAASACENATSGGYTDWYLPSKEELDLIYVNLFLQGLGNLSGGNYWNSTEFDINNAWKLNMSVGFHFYSFKTNADNVRAIRTF